MPTNLYGPNDNYDPTSSHVLPALLRKVHEAKDGPGRRPVEVWGTGTPRREFLHVDDLADATSSRCRHYTGEQHLNVGWGEDISIRELAELIAEVVGWDGELTFDTSMPDGMPRKLLDVSAARSAPTCATPCSPPAPRCLPRQLQHRLGGQHRPPVRPTAVHFVDHDVTDYLTCPGPVDAVLHFASPASPIDYLELPIQTLKVGSLGTHNALGLAKAKGARFLLASTSEVYGDPQVHPQPETYWGHVNPIGPRGVYDEAKRFARR
jgi:nucleoside-diphosphate-sugar epimerase